jgi:hypothetical protein
MTWCSPVVSSTAAREMRSISEIAIARWKRRIAAPYRLCIAVLTGVGAIYLGGVALGFSEQVVVAVIALIGATMIQGYAISAKRFPNRFPAMPLAADDARLREFGFRRALALKIIKHREAPDCGSAD